jgi:hypothetical protein
MLPLGHGYPPDALRWRPAFRLAAGLRQSGGIEAAEVEIGSYACQVVVDRTGGQMSDPYLEAIQEQWPNIRSLYSIYERKRPIILYDLQEKKIYAYPYKEFRTELNEKSQESLKRDYESASTHGSMIVFVRDNIQRKLVSYIMSTDSVSIQ